MPNVLLGQGFSQSGHPGSRSILGLSLGLRLGPSVFDKGWGVEVRLPCAKTTNILPCCLQGFGLGVYG